MSYRSPKGYGDRGPRPDGLTEKDRANLRELLRAMYRREKTWIAVARILAFKPQTLIRFVGQTFSGNMALARTIARAVKLSLKDALEGRFSITANDKILSRKPRNARKRGAK